MHLLEVHHDAQQKQWQQKNLQQERLKAEQKQRSNQHQSLEQEVGSQEQIAQIIETLTSQQHQLEVHIQELQQQTQEQQHLDPKAELETLDHLEHQLTEQRHELGIQRGALLERCDSLGQSDLHSAVAEASAKLDLAKQAEQQEALLIRARSHLLQRFQQARSDLSQRYSNPLKRNINQVLQPLLGNPNDGCSLSYDPKDGLQELGLQREGTLFAFNQLSGGMKEQLNAALRIAIADTLKERHGGCLPLLFDDAFTNTDTQRLKGVLEMLTQAVSRGLQIIILSCDPEPYKTIADKIIMID
jgi:DNA repair exonuclease SbcCD ATPase subunit